MYLLIVTNLVYDKEYEQCSIISKHGGVCFLKTDWRSSTYNVKSNGPRFSDIAF